MKRLSPELNVGVPHLRNSIRDRDRAEAPARKDRACHFARESATIDTFPAEDDLHSIIIHSIALKVPVRLLEFGFSRSGGPASVANRRGIAEVPLCSPHMISDFEKF